MEMCICVVKLGTVNMKPDWNLNLTKSESNQLQVLIDLSGLSTWVMQFQTQAQAKSTCEPVTTI